MLSALVLSAIALQSQPRIEVVWSLELDRANVGLFPITRNDDWTLLFDSGFQRLTIADGELSSPTMGELQISDRAVPPDLVLQWEPDDINRRFLPDFAVYDVWRSIFDHPSSYEPAKGWDTIIRAPLFFPTRPPGLPEGEPSVTFVYDGAALIAEGEEKVYRFSKEDWSVAKEAPKPVQAHTNSRLTSDVFIAFNIDVDTEGVESHSSFAITTELEPVETGALFESFLLDRSVLLAATAGEPAQEGGYVSRSGVELIDLSKGERVWHRGDVGIGSLSEIEVQATVWNDRVVVTESRAPFQASAVLVLDFNTGETVTTRRVLGKVIGVYTFGKFLVLKSLADGRVSLRGLRLD